MACKPLPRFELNGITVAYEKYTLSNISFSCNGGDILALIGRNGAGKTTTIDSIMGLTTLKSGIIRYNGQPVTEANEHQFKEKVGYVGASQEYYPNIRVGTFLRVVSGFYPHWDKSIIEQYLSSFSIDPDKKLSQLSSGMKVKLSLAIALSHSAEIFLLDEPTAGLDPIVREQVLEILERLAREIGACILFSSHITQDVEKIASRVLFLVDGTIALNADMKTLDERFVKLRVDDSRLPLKRINQKGVILNDSYIILEKADATPEMLSLCERAPLLIEDVLIFLNGGVRSAPAD
ncbi:MAG: ABC transporter ATP-binding protein [Clostridia bacterium]|nr:ABC transporter ATP-binding protein [Clostridia bacterium]